MRQMGTGIVTLLPAVGDLPLWQALSWWKRWPFVVQSLSPMKKASPRLSLPLTAYQWYIVFNLQWLIVPLLAQSLKDIKARSLGFTSCVFCHVFACLMLLHIN
jgi:hypothetical protein